MFLKYKIKYYVAPVVIICLIFVVYQIKIFAQISTSRLVKTNQNSEYEEGGLVRGTHKRQMGFYTPTSNGKFTCIQSMEVIPFSQVNDDYCDCMDGSDEPGTNACSDGKFYCTKQVQNTKYKNSIISFKVNDGVCDCCDGSDEYKSKYVSLQLNENTHMIDERVLTCPNICDQ